METQRITEFPHKNMDKRPRKRPRLNWDMPPALPPPKVCSGLSFDVLSLVRFGTFFIESYVEFGVSGLFFPFVWRTHLIDGNLIDSIDFLPSRVNLNVV